PADGVPLPTKQVARDRVLDDKEIVSIILAARKIGTPYGGIIEFLVLTGQRRKEVARLTWDELDFEERIWAIPAVRTKNGKAHVVHLSEQAITALNGMERRGRFVFSVYGNKPFSAFGDVKPTLDKSSGVTGWRLHDLRRTCVSGMARLGVAPHVAD